MTASSDPSAPGRRIERATLTLAGGEELAAFARHCRDDLDDVEVPYREGQLLAHAWPGARLVTTAGLGHRRILRDARVVGEAEELFRMQSASAAA